MKLFRYFLDGTQLQDDPIGWDESKWVIHRVKELNALLLRIDVQLEFWGDGYGYLANAFDTNGHCGTVEIEIQELKSDGTYRRIHNGQIFLSSITRDRKEFTIKCKIDDNSFYSKINTNKNIAAFPFAQRSKNDVAIAACPLVYANFGSPCDCGVYARLVAAPYTYTGAMYRSFDLLEYLVNFMTDGEVDFQSTLFDTGGDLEGTLWTCGMVIRTYIAGTTQTAFEDNFPKLSFQYVFNELSKKYNLGMMIDNSGARPKLIIERDSYFKQTTTAHTCSDIDRVIETVDESKLYAKLILGSSKTRSVAVQCPPNGLNFPERISLLGFKEEEFIILGECNLDSELNLRSDAVISHNIIEDCLVNGASSNDKDPFIIICEPYYGNWITKLANIFNDATPCYFNTDINNISCTENWLTGIPNQFAQYLLSTTPEFQASATTSVIKSGNPQDMADPYPYNDDSTLPNFDTGANYNNATYRYTAPDDGIYSFETFTQVYYDHVFPAGGSIVFHVELQIYDSGNVLLDTRSHSQTITINLQTDLFFSDSVYMSATDYANIKMRYTMTGGSVAATNVRVLTGAIFRCTASATGGGVYAEVNPADYPVINHSFDKEITPTQFETILADPRGLIACTTHQNYSFSGWIEELSFQRAKGQAKWKLFSTYNLNHE